MAEPYKSEILPHWRFKTLGEAKKSSQKIYELFEAYGRANDFVGMDMARKYLQMGFTRARRYANYPSGRKYDAKSGKALPQAADWHNSEKARAAQIFYEVYVRAKSDPHYVELRAKHKQKYETKNDIL